MSAIPSPALVAGTIGTAELAEFLNCSREHVRKHREDLERQFGTKAFAVKAGEYRWPVKDLIAAGVVMEAP